MHAGDSERKLEGGRKVVKFQCLGNPDVTQKGQNNLDPGKGWSTGWRLQPTFCMTEFPLSPGRMTHAVGPFSVVPF